MRKHCPDCAAPLRLLPPFNNRSMCDQCGYTESANQEKDFIDFVNKFHVKGPTPQSLWQLLERSVDRLQDTVTEGDRLQIALGTGQVRDIFDRLLCLVLERHGTFRDGKKPEDWEGVCDWCGDDVEGWNK